MNYFGLFFTFMVPGIIMGITAAAAIIRHIKAKQKAERIARKAAHIQKSKQLYVCSLTKDDMRIAA